MNSPGALGKNRDFNVFLAGQVVSHMGHALMHVALPSLILATTGSVSDMGLATASILAGRFAGGLFAGPLVDRVDRRHIMLFCDVASAAVYMAIPVLWFAGLRHVGLLYAMGFVGNLLGNTFYVAQVAALPAMVERGQLTEANGRMMAGQAAAVFFGPFLGGVLCAAMGAPLTIGINGLTFVVSALCLMVVRLRPSAASEAAASPEATARLRDNVLAGVRFLWRHPVLRALVMLMTATELMIAGSIDLFVFRLKNDMGQGDVVLGVVFAVASLGAIAGGVLAATMRRRLGFGISLLAMLIIEGVCLALMGQVTTVVAMTAAALAYAFGSSGWGVFTTTIRQELVPEVLLGRVTSAFSVMMSAVAPLGAAGATYLAEHIGVSRVMTIIGAGYVVVAALGALTPVRAPGAHSTRTSPGHLPG